MVVKIGKHQLNVVKEPEIFLDGEKGIMSIILTVEKDGEKYELHYISSMDDPDLVVTENFFLEYKHNKLIERN